VLRHLDAAALEIGHDLVDHVLVAGLFEIGPDDALGIGLRLGARDAEQFRGPQAEQLVAPRRRFELQFLVVLELVLEGRLAIVETAHISLYLSWCGKPRKCGALASVKWLDGPGASSL
jgi:hypothetical protein